ncbi:PucR family transcriptional regulator [Alkaliphilus transvaalensis]|uniref:PucR family transcriptional regulator n=1 Tax=Alkaliphilus transvaalensis TaxID=114628 RepID=UPI00047989BC|nr:helix-turn-helix domain-containing protein [Alkaliphilus transvaalensis]
MNTLSKLFQQIHRAYPYKLTIVDHTLRPVVTSSNGENIVDSPVDPATYPIKTPINRGYFLMSEEELSKDTLVLLEILIGILLEDLNNLNKKQILQYMLEGNIDIAVIEGNSLRYKKLFNASAYRVLFIETPPASEIVEVLELIEECFREEEELTTVPLKEGLFILIEEDKSKEGLLNIAKLIRDMVNAELFLDLFIGISTKFQDIRKLPEVLTAVRKSLEIGKSLVQKSRIILEEEMTLEKTLLAIPKEERKKLYIEIYGKSGYDEIDEVLQSTIEVFLKNNLNAAETAKNLYIHRNTLSYRLDRIHKILGLDLRKFEDAMFYKIAILLRKSI